MKTLGLILFACLLIACAIYLCGTQPMNEGDLNRLKQRVDYQFGR